MSATTIDIPAQSGRPRPERVVGRALAVFRHSLGDPALRRAQLAFGLLWSSEWALTVALTVIAFRAGGAAAVAALAAVRMLPAAVMAPLTTVLADRLPRARILLGAALARATVLAIAARCAGAHDGMAWLYLLTAVAAVAFVTVRPAHSALLPALCQTPDQLSAATAVRGLMDSVGTLVGPLVATSLLVVASPAAVIAVVAVSTGLAGLLIWGIDGAGPPVRPTAAAPRLRARSAIRDARRYARDSAAGIAGLARHRDAGVVLCVALTQTFTRGCLGVLTVVMAAGMLHSGPAGVGALSTAIGAGAVAGSLGAVTLASSGALARWEGVGAALWGLPLVLAAAVPHETVVLGCLAAVGAGNALIDVGLFSLPAWIVPDELLGRVFGTFESLISLTVALGSLVASVLVAWLGIRGALVAVGAVAPAFTALSWPRLARIDRRVNRDRRARGERRKADVGRAERDRRIGADRRVGGDRRAGTAIDEVGVSVVAVSR